MLSTANAFLFLPMALRRRPLRSLSVGRVLSGGRLSDAGRLPRYAVMFMFGAAAIWGPIGAYLTVAPLSYTSSTSLILPGSGAAASVNLNNIGQASSSANSAFSSNSISPTETYKRLIGADRILDAAASSLGVARSDLGKPRIELVDQTGLIHFQMTGGAPEAAQKKGEALLAAFFAELDALRSDELATRQDSGLDAIAEYRESVRATREDIAALQARTGLASAEQYDDQVAALDTLRREAETLAAGLAQKGAAVRALEAALGVGAARAATALKLYADADFLSLMAEQAGHAATLADMRSRYGARHPKVEKARSAHRASLTAAEARATEVTGLAHAALDLAPEGQRADLLADLVRMESERAGLEREYAATAARLRAETDRLARLAPDAARLEDMRRDFAVAEAVFASAIARNQSSKVDVYASYPLVQVLENPSLPDRPSSPRRMLAIAAGGAATTMLLIGLGLGWIRRAVILRLIGARGQ